MTNDTFAYLNQGSVQNNLQPLALGASTAEASFSVNGNSAANPVIAAKPAILRLCDQGIIPSSGASPVFFWDSGKPFYLQGWGKCVTGANATLTLKLYQVPKSVIDAGLAAGSVVGCQLLATSTARAVNTTTGKFVFQAEFQWDATTGLLHGQFTDQISNLLDAWAATTAVTTLLQDADLNFLMSATLSAGNAANVVTLSELAAMLM